MSTKNRSFATFCTSCGIAVVASISVHTSAANFTSLEGITSGFRTSYASSISRDGTTVVGHEISDFGTTAFKWTLVGGYEYLDTILPTGTYQSIIPIDVSENGTTIVGEWRPGDSAETQGFRWTAATGFETLFGPFTRARAVSDSGDVILGSSFIDGTPYRWINGQGESEVGEFFAHDISGDGNTVVGGVNLQAVTWSEDLGLRAVGNGTGRAISRNGDTVISTYNGNVYTWNAQNGTQLIGPGIGLDVSSDGTIVLGKTPTAEPWLWTEADGFTYLESDLGLQIDGWRLEFPNSISGDGRTVVGSGYSPSGMSRGWVITIPEPSTLIFFGIAIALSRHRRSSNLVTSPA